MDKNLALNPNRVVSFLGKDPKEFTLDDMITFVEENEIKMINFMYPAQDGRVKTLNFVINSRAYLEILLSGKSFTGQKNKAETLLQDSSLFCYFACCKKR